MKTGVSMCRPTAGDLGMDIRIFGVLYGGRIEGLVIHRRKYIAVKLMT